MRARNGLARFREAQKDDYWLALEEIKAKTKKNHWIWYIFPQFKELGYSEMALYYGVQDAAEAKAYLEDETLGVRLRRCFEILVEKYADFEEVLAAFGEVDAMKIRSCATLFMAVDEAGNSVFKKAIEKFYDGRVDEATMRLLRRGG